MNSTSEGEIITRDVCIIGGGSSGTYAAVQLRKAGKSIVVVEKENVLGGQTHTYSDPITNKPIDYGVVSFENLPVVIDYFDYLQIPWINESSFDAVGTTTYFDFNTSMIENNVTIPSPKAGLQAYAAQLIKYLPLQDGFYLPNPIPDDLLLPFGEFITKYKLSGAVSLFLKFAQGLGDILKQATLYLLKNFSLNIVEKDLVDGFIVPKDHNNSNIYDKAYKLLLADNVLLQSHPIQVKRTRDLVEVTVQTPTGCKLIKAKKLLVTIPPNSLYGFDLNANESRIFSQFGYTGYFTGLIRNTGLPANTTIENINLRNPYGAPTLPALYGISATTVDGIFDVKYGSPRNMSEDDVKADIIESILKLQRDGVAKKTLQSLEFVEFRSHIPFELTVSVEAIKAGFYKELYGLQGERNTFWTGAAFHTQNSGLLWQFTKDFVLPVLIGTL